MKPMQLSEDKRYQLLLEQLEMAARTVDRKGFLLALQSWLFDNIRWLGDSAPQFGLDDYARYDLDALPLEMTEFDPAVEYAQLLRVVPSKKSSLSMFLRDIFWEGITLIHPQPCPVCTGNLRVLTEDGSAPILGCDQCSWAQYVDGTRWIRKPAWLRPASTEELKNWGYDINPGDPLA
jgi:hypothetical protein